jgi:hypothetical protein
MSLTLLHLDLLSFPNSILESQQSAIAREVTLLTGVIVSGKGDATSKGILTRVGASQTRPAEPAQIQAPDRPDHSIVEIQRRSGA